VSTDVGTEVRTGASANVGVNFLQQASTFAATPAPVALQELRAAGAAAFAQLGFPSTRSEDWAYTNVSAIAETTFVASSSRAPSTLHDVSRLEPYTFGGAWPMLVFLNGNFMPALSSFVTLPDGVRVMTLAHAAEHEPELLQRHLGTAATPDRDGFSALNAAFAFQGTLIHVSKEMVTDVPVHLLHVTDAAGAGVMSHVRHLVIVERHAKASVIESYVALDDVSYLTNTVTEVIVEDGATLQHARVQRESLSAFHVGTIEARQGRDSHFIQFSFQTGAQLSRSNVYTVLDGDGCGTTLNGLYMLDGAQHGDHQTRVEHVAPNCFSREMYKGLLDGESHGVFNGKVYVHPEAQKTDGKQTNNTLLLSPTSQIDTKPQLEIFADDVKCTHGATVGRMDETSLFYLKSRGVGSVLAKQLLMYAFAADVLETLENSTLKEELERLTLARFTGIPQH
jgi:Fe-S cluster assembly protein SufD